MKPKHYPILLTLAITSLLITSCGNKTKDVSAVNITPKTISVKGDLGEYFEVVSKECQIKPDETGWRNKEKWGIISVEVKRNSKDFSFPANKADRFGVSGIGVYYNVGFGIELFSDNGPEEILNANDEESPLKKEDVLSLINLQKGQTGFIRFSVDKSKSIKTFQLTSALKNNAVSLKNDSPDINSPASSAKEENISTDKETPSADIKKSSAECDKFIIKYEAFINSYIKIIKKYKANPTDASIMNEYTEAVQKAGEMGNNVSLCTDSKYAVKLLELQTKLTKAAL